MQLRTLYWSRDVLGRRITLQHGGHGVAECLFCKHPPLFRMQSQDVSAVICACARAAQDIPDILRLVGATLLVRATLLRVHV